MFADDCGTKWPKAAAKITDDLDVLLAFYDYPADYWIHLCTTNPIESTVAGACRARNGRLSRTPAGCSRRALDVIGRPAAPYEGPLRGLTRPVRR